MSKKESSTIQEIQKTACKTRRKGYDSFKAMSHCFSCEEGRGGCRFAGCRTLIHSEDSQRITFDYSGGTDPHFPMVFNRKMTAEIAARKLTACAHILLPLLLVEEVHCQRPNMIYRKRELRPRVTCDVCATTLFFQSWLCTSCGREICVACMSSLNESNPITTQCSSQTATSHRESDFLPVSRFAEEELNSAINSMRFHLQNHSMPVLAHPTSRQNFDIAVAASTDHDGNKSPSRRITPTLSVRTFNVTEFERHWSQGIPVVITDVDSRLQGDWGPSYFIQQYGREKVVIQNCETQTNRQSTVAEFFRDFGGPTERTRILKLKDWPPQKDFREQFLELFHAFMDAVPHPDLARLDGVLNLAAHFPRNGVAPDLGPKMYNAHGSKQDNEHHGSTNLHMDLTDAVNVMIWAAQRDGEAGYAVWHIFPAATSDLIRKFLKEEEGFTGPGDAIHSQCFYLTPAMLHRLAAKYNVLPYLIYQHPGEAVYIPAGCAHQVSNAADAIKIACDFVSINNLAETQRLVGELRQQRLSSAWGDDVLQFYATLWYTWTSLSELYPTISSDSEDPFYNWPEASAQSEDVQMASDSSDHDYVVVPFCDTPALMAVDGDIHGSAKDHNEKSDTISPPIVMKVVCPEASAQTKDIQMAGDSDSFDPANIVVPCSDTTPLMFVDGDIHRPVECHHEEHNTLSPSAAKGLRRKEQRKGKRALASLERPYKKGHDFLCPFSISQRAFNSGGLIDHLKSSHAHDITELDATTMRYLRRQHTFTNSDMKEYLRPFFRNPDGGHKDCMAQYSLSHRQ